MASFSWLTAAVALLPVLATAAVKLIATIVDNRVEHRLERQVQLHAELLRSLPVGVDPARLISLVDEELAALSLRSQIRMYRRVHKWNVAAMVVLLVGTTGLVGIFWWLEPQQRWLDVALMVLASAIGLCGSLSATVGGLGDLYEDIRGDGANQKVDKKKPPTTADKSRQPDQQARRPGRTRSEATRRTPSWAGPIRPVACRPERGEQPLRNLGVKVPCLDLGQLDAAQRLAATARGWGVQRFPMREHFPPPSSPKAGNAGWQNTVSPSSIARIRVAVAARVTKIAATNESVCST